MTATACHRGERHFNWAVLTTMICNSPSTSTGFFFFLANFILVDYSDSEDNYIQQRRGCDRTHFQVPPTPHSRFQSLLAVFSHFLPLPIFCFRLPFVIPYHPCFGAPHTPFSSLPKPVLISQTPVFS